MTHPKISYASLAFAFYFIALVPVAVRSQSCATGKVDDRVADFLKKKGPDKTLAQLKASPIEQFKNNGNGIFKKLPDDSVKRIMITSDNIKVNVVKASQKSGLPVIINYHSGGFIRPLVPSMEYDAMLLARKLNAVVFDVDYRVAPENKFPTAVDDAYNAYRWVSDHAREFGGDPDKIILNGTEAGGNLAALVMHRAKKEGKLQGVKLVMMICPSTDNPMISYYSSFDENASGYLLTKDLVFFYFQTYLEKNEWFKNDPALSPIYEKDFSGMPPSLIVVAEFDVLRDEGIAYGKKLENGNNDVSIKCFPHQINSLTGLPNDSGEIKSLYDLIGEKIAKIGTAKK
jgi:acetyl esterase